MARAKAGGTKTGKAIGRPAISAEMKERIRVRLRDGAGSERDIAAQLQVSRGAVYRVCAELRVASLEPE